MKHLYLLLLAVALLPFAANAQFSEDFEGTTGSLPTGWEIYNEDGLMPHSDVNQVTTAFQTDAWVILTYQGNKVATSTSYYNPPGQSDDWMVTPQITIPATNPFLIYEVAAYNPNYADDYEVLISTTGNTPADFSTVIYSEADPAADFTPIAVNLSAYAGQQVYIAFRNVATDDWFLFVDNVEVKSLDNNDAAITNLSLTDYSAIGANNTLEVTLKNAGMNPITSVDITWSDGMNNYTANVTGLNLQSYVTTTISHNIPVSYGSLVEKTITVTASNINGNTDPNLAENTDTILFHTVNPGATKYVVVEEGTGTWCVWCPRGIVAMEYMYANPALFPNFIGIAVHNGDPMVVPEYDNSVDLSGYPGSNIDRAILGTGVNKNIWANAYNSRKAVVTPADVGITTTYNTTTREITAAVSATFYTDLAEVDEVRFAIVVVEDDVTGTTAGYAQANAYAGGANGPMGGFENLPNPVPAADMVYDRVGIALLGGYSGEIGSVSAGIAASDTRSYTFTYTLPSDSDASKVSLVALLIDQSTGEILNAKENDANLGIVENPAAIENIQVYPNPSSEFVKVSFGMTMPDDVRLNIYSMTGALVKTQNFQNISGNQDIQVDISGLSAGEYLISLSTNEGAVVKTIIVEK